MNLKKTAYLTLLAAAASGLVACDDFLDVDPSKSTQKTIETAEQLDALLGSYSRFYSEYNHTALACDDFGLTTDIHDYQNGGMSPSNLEYILWSDQGTGTSRLLWDGEYSKIYYANLVLAYIDEVSGDAETKANLKAEAHFLRAYSMFQLAVAYTLYYDGSNGSELGLPLKQTISFEEGIARASLADTWSFIDNDLQEALKITTPLVEQGKRRVWRGTTAAVHAFAARYYLYRGDLDTPRHSGGRTRGVQHTQGLQHLDVVQRQRRRVRDQRLDEQGDSDGEVPLHETPVLRNERISGALRVGGPALRPHVLLRFVVVHSQRGSARNL